MTDKQMPAFYERITKRLEEAVISTGQQGFFHLLEFRSLPPQPTSPLNIFIDFGSDTLIMGAFEVGSDNDALSAESTTGDVTNPKISIFEFPISERGAEAAVAYAHRWLQERAREMWSLRS